MGQIAWATTTHLLPLGPNEDSFADQFAWASHIVWSVGHDYWLLLMGLLAGFFGVLLIIRFLQK